MKQLFDWDLVLRQKFVDCQLVPLGVELLFPNDLNVEEGDYVMIDTLTVHFIVNYVNLKQRQRFDGHLAMIGVGRPNDFPLSKSSRIVFVVKYSHFKAGRMHRQELVHEINIGSLQEKQLGIDSITAILSAEPPAAVISTIINRST